MEKSNAARSPGTSEAIIAFLVLLCFSAFWLAGQKPGMLIHDTTDSWAQAASLKFSNWHPFFYSLTLVPFQRFFGSPFAIAVVQCLLFALGTSAFVKFLVARGLSRWMVATFFALTFTSVPLFVYLVTVSKDTTYGLSLITLVVFAGWAAANRKPGNMWICAVLGVGLFLAANFRHNGIPLILLFPAALWASRKYPLSAVLPILAIASSLTLIVQVGISRALHMQSTAKAMKIQLVVQPIGAYLTSPTYVTTDWAEDQRIFGKVQSIEDWRRFHTPGSVAWAFFQPHVQKNIERMSDEDASEVVRHAIIRAPYNLPILAADRVLTTVETYFPARCILFGNALDQAPPGRYAMSQEPLVPSFLRYQASLLQWIDGCRPLRILLFESVLHAIFLVLLLCDRKKAPLSAAFAFTTLAMLLLLAAVQVSSDFRYIWYIQPIAYFLLPFWWAERQGLLVPRKTEFNEETTPT